MKLIVIAVLVIFAVVTSNADLQCDVKGGDVDTEWLDMTNGCIKEVRRQIQAEINASVNYLAMAAHFSKDTVNRPGFAKFFFHSASEEREHAMKLIEYLLMRSPLENPDKDSEDSLIQVNQPTKVTWPRAIDALEDALKMEASVTKSIKQVIAKCENDEKQIEINNVVKTVRNVNDYHLVDYLTGEFLDEQYKGQRELAGKISTLKKMMDSSINKALGEFLFDKEM